MTGKGIESWNPQDLKDLRERHSLTQKELAEIMGVTIDYISKIERGIRKPSKIFKNFLFYLENDLTKKGERLNGKGIV